MSNEAQGLVRLMPLKSPLKPVLMAYANYCDVSGYCWPSVETIAFDTGLSTATVKRARARLTAAGWMGAKRRWGSSAMTRLNLAAIKAAGVDRGEHGSVNHPPIEFDPEPPEPNARPLSDHSEPTANPVQPDRCDPPVRITEIRSSKPGDPLSLNEPSLDPSIEGARERGSTPPPPKPAPTPDVVPVDWATELVAELDYGRHRRPTPSQADELADLLRAAHDTHRLGQRELRRHCQTTLRDAIRSGVGYLRGGLDPTHLPVPTPPPAVAAPDPSRGRSPVVSDDFTADDLLARGLLPAFLPSRLRHARAA